MPTNCTVCGRLYLHKSGLNRHMKPHQQLLQPSTCGQCGKIFSRPDNLSKHPRQRTGHIERIEVGILQLPIVTVDIMAVRPFTK